ncbi:MAG: replicative DNA helicase, partial [Anaerolineales bacterium]|nr:replicative DNA helicase [Anaerolineales bacterium]
SVLIDQDAYYEVASTLRPEDFYSVKHRWVWNAFAALHDQNTPIDQLTTQDELDSRGHLQEIGGFAYLTQLVTRVPTAFNVAAYGKLVEEAAIRRRLIQAAGDVAKLAYDEKTDINEVVNQAEQTLFGVSEGRSSRDLIRIRDVAHDYYDRVQQLYDNRGTIVGVPTGFRDLDTLLGGMQKSDLIIVAGRPGKGKSAFMVSVALNAARTHKQRVALFSLEMSNEQVMQRMVAQETHIDTHQLRLGELEDEQMDSFIHSVNLLSDLGIFLDDTPSISAMQLRAKSRRLAAEVKLDLIIVDYLQLMVADVRRDANRVQEVSEISRSLKALARELHVPVLAGAQLSRGVEQRAGQRPLLSDLRESGSIEQDSDVVLFLHHPDEWDEDPQRKQVTELLVSKHRNGKTGSMEMVFLPAYAQFVDAAHRSVVLED